MQIVRISGLLVCALLVLTGCEGGAPARDNETTAESSTVADEDPRFIPPVNVAAPPAHASKTDQGLFYVILEQGEGDESPQPQDKVTIHHTGWTTDGSMFHSSHTQGAPMTTVLQNLIEGHRLALATMKRGEKRRLWIPEHLAAGHGVVFERRLARPGQWSPAGMWHSAMLGLGLRSEPDPNELMLVFDVELVDFESP